jgi:putative SbcD/Mre11-related phosphoesterase
MLTESIHLDVRRAAWLPASRCLVVADLHLGRAWVQRARGQLVPVSAGEDSLPRLASLTQDYQPDRLVVVGDIVHAALPVPGVEAMVRELASLATHKTRLELCLGNHDRRLGDLLAAWRIPVTVHTQVVLPEAVLFHGDVEPDRGDSGDRWFLQGHEHPAVVLGDGVASSAKVPCFLSGPRHLVLPAFSQGSTGCAIGRDPFLATPARGARLDTVIACLGKRLLRIPLSTLLGAAGAGPGTAAPDLFPPRRIRP